MISITETLFHYLCLSLLLTLPHLSYAEQPQKDAVAQTTQNIRPTLDYESPLELMKDFLNLSKRTDSPLKYWATQLLLIVGKDRRFSKFKKEIVAATKTRNAKRIGLAFLTNKEHFDPALKAYIVKKGIKKVQAIIEKRAKK